MKVLICGGRDFQGSTALRRTILEARPSLIITGGARGADTLGDQLADELGHRPGHLPCELVRRGARGRVQPQPADARSDPPRSRHRLRGRARHRRHGAASRASGSPSPACRRGRIPLPRICTATSSEPKPGQPPCQGNRPLEQSGQAYPRSVGASIPWKKGNRPGRNLGNPAL